MEFVIEFDTRTALVGPFHSEDEAERAAVEIGQQRNISNWRIRAMQLPGLALRGSV